MKATAVFLLLSLALCCCQGNAEPGGAANQGTEPACGVYDLTKGCTKIFEPICGTDNAEYSNECVLCLHNLRRKTDVRIKNWGTCQPSSLHSKSTRT